MACIRHAAPTYLYKDAQSAYIVAMNFLENNVLPPLPQNRAKNSATL